MVDTDELLRNHIAGIYASLVEGSREPKKAQQLIDDLHRAQRKLDVGDDRYALCPRPIDAVVRFLNDHGSPAPEAEIIKGVIRGGFRGGKDENARSIHASIAIFLRGTGARTENIKEVNGLIGLWDWPDERFM